jgi:multidrug efflux system outer membrane protein
MRSEFMATLFISCMLALQSGCALGPDYVRPDQEMSAGYRSNVEMETDTSFADLQWRQIYSDPVLQGLISEALSSAPDLLIAEARVREAEAIAGITRSELYPQLGLSWNTSPIARPDGKDFGSSFLGGANISWELDLWGRLRRADEAGKAALLASEENRRALVASLISKVAGLYYQLAAQHEIYRVADRTAINQRDALHLIKRLSDSGISSAAEVRQQEVALAVTEATLPDLRQRIAVAENALSILLGRIPGVIDIGMDATITLPQIIPVGLPNTLLERRPDLRSAELQLVAANAKVGEAKAMFFPTFSLTGFFGGISTSASDFLSGGTATVASLGFNALQPLFAGKYYFFNYDSALARLDQALIGYRKAVLTAMAEVEDALTTYKEAGNTLLVQRRRVESARESLRLADMRYRAGVVSFIEVLDAQRQLFSAETAEVETLLSRRLALSNIYLALGGGWEQEGNGAKQP